MLTAHYKEKWALCALNSSVVMQPTECTDINLPSLCSQELGLRGHVQKKNADTLVAVNAVNKIFSFTSDPGVLVPCQHL